jgi:hypothetical protein
MWFVLRYQYQPGVAIERPRGTAARPIARPGPLVLYFVLDRVTMAQIDRAPSSITCGVSTRLVGLFKELFKANKREAARCTGHEVGSTIFGGAMPLPWLLWIQQRAEYHAVLYV